MDQSTTNVSLKQCARRDKCINPMGCWLPATSENFGKDKYRADGFSKWCRACKNESDRIGRIKHADRIREYKRKWRVDNADKQREYDQRNYAKNPQKERETSRSYHKAHPEISRNKRMRRISRALLLPTGFTPDDWDRALGYFNGCCAVCGRQMRDLFSTHTAAMDHWIPISKGGGFIPSNIVPLCHGVGGCNNRKSNRDPVEFLESTFGKHRARSILKRINSYFEWIKQ